MDSRSQFDAIDVTVGKRAKKAEERGDSAPIEGRANGSVKIDSVSRSQADAWGMSGEPEPILHPGNRIHCEDCGANDPLILVDSHLCCPQCNSPIGGAYDTLDRARPRSEFPESGSESSGGGGHGPGHQLGEVPSGTMIGPGEGISAGAKRQQKWSNYKSAGSPSRMQSMELIRTHLSEFPQLKKKALELLTKIAWPSEEEDKTPQFPLVWQVAHPWGIPSAAAASIHAAYIVFGIQPDKKALAGIFHTKGEANHCLKPNKVLNKAIKAMTKRMGRKYTQIALNRVVRAQLLVDSLVARNPELIPIHSTLFEDATRMAQDREHFPDNLINPIACLTWFVATEHDANLQGRRSGYLNLTQKRVSEMFDGFVHTSTAFRKWGGLISIHIRGESLSKGRGGEL